MILPITALFTGLLALWYVRLALAVIFARADGATDPKRPVRIQANFVECIPLALFMMALLEFHGLVPLVLYSYGLALLIGRVLHRNGVRTQSVTLRTWGMQLTLWPIMIAASILIYTWFAQQFLF